MFTAHASIHLPISPQWVWMHASRPDFLGFIPPVSTVENIGNDRFAIQIEGLQDEGYCVVKSTLREPPYRIAWHSVGGILHLRAEIVIEHHGVGSRLSVQIYALPRDARMYAGPRLERSFEGIGDALRRGLERFATRFASPMVAIR